MVWSEVRAGAGSSAIYGRTILHMTGDEHRRKAAIVARRIRNRREPVDQGFMLRSAPELSLHLHY